MKHEQSLLVPLTEEEIRLLTEALDNIIYESYMSDTTKLEKLRAKLEDILDQPDSKLDSIIGN